MRVFARVVDLGSFHLAAKQLGTSAAAATRSVRILEEHLNVRLLNRSTRSLSLTDVGRLYLDGCRAVIEKLDEVESDLVRATRDPGGTLRIAAPATFAAAGLGALSASYLAVNPRVSFDITVYDTHIDMIEGGFDICFSAERNQGNSSLVSRQLTSVEDVVVASPTYLSRRGTPRGPDELSRHDLLSVQDAMSTSWELGDEHKTYRVTAGTALSATSCAMVRTAALAHMGIAVLPVPFVAEDLAKGALVRVLGRFQICGGLRQITMLYSGRNYLSMKVRSFIDFTVDQYRGMGKPTALRVVA
jgi:DNA-binding transcriptional LysR family regulator